MLSEQTKKEIEAIMDANKGQIPPPPRQYPEEVGPGPLAVVGPLTLIMFAIFVIGYAIKVFF